MKSFFLTIQLLILVLIAPSTLAQMQFREGLIVTNGQDTLRGFIEASESDLNPVTIGFKLTQTGEVKSYGVEEVTYFSVANSVAYQRFSVNVSVEPVELKQVQGFTNLPPVRKAVFLRVVQSGRLLSLYAYRDELKPRYYALHSGLKEPEELVYKVFKVVKTGGQLGVENFAFRDFLKNFAVQKGIMTPSLDYMISKTFYIESGLLKVVSAINGVKVETVKPKIKESTGLTIGGGLNIATLHYQHSNQVGSDELVKNASSKPSLKYWFSLGYDLAKNPLVGKAVFRADVSFSETQFRTDTYNYAYSRHIDMWHSFKQRNVTLGVYFIYYFYKKENFKMYAGAGGRLNFSAYDYAYQYQLTTQSTPPIVETAELKDAEPKKTWGTIPLNAGIMMGKRLELRISYSFPSALSGDEFRYKYSANNFQTGLVYHL